MTVDGTTKARAMRIVFADQDRQTHESTDFCCGRCSFWLILNRPLYIQGNVMSQWGNDKPDEQGEYEHGEEEWIDSEPSCVHARHSPSDPFPSIQIVLR
jgi:hypothetical protein